MDYINIDMDVTGRAHPGDQWSHGGCSEIHQKARQVRLSGIDGPTRRCGSEMATATAMRRLAWLVS